MANKKFTELDNLASPAGADILAIVDDIAGTATTKKVTATNLMTLAPVQSVAGRTGTVTLSNTDVSGLGTAATQDVGTSNGNVVQLDSTGLPAVDGSQLTGISTAVDGTEVTSTGQIGATKFLREDGDGTCSFQTVSISDENLRGTDNPHIGSNPNQSLMVMDNPFKSAMVVADADGNVTYLLKGGSAEVKVAKANGTPVRFALASDLPAFVLENDSGEPDIEVSEPTTGEKISVISGDSDTKGANGLPIRQVYNLPDIGANPSPILISGGSIA
jgi:hypothetical protein